MEYVLKTNGLTKRYRKFTALDNLNMSIPKGAIYGFVGKNGAGKTTLIRLICGLQTPTSGDLELYGVKNNSKEILAQRRRVGAVVETPSIYLGMTAEENLKMQYLTLGMPDYKGIPELLELVGLPDVGQKRVRNFSLGMKQRLGIAIALCGDPDFLVLDEPINGLDPQGIIEIRELILKLNREREITFLISSHILDELSRLATHYGFIDSGHVVREMSAEELEQASSKSMRIEVTDAKALSLALDKLGLEYKLVGDNSADVYGKPNITKLAVELQSSGCEILSVNERDESLESFFISLVGGGKS